MPKISVVVSTRNRAESVRLTVDSILANDYRNFELILVDQSAAPRTPAAVGGSHQPFRYVHTDTVGVSAARNAGFGLASGEIIAHTDDDCEAPADWVTAIARVFTNNPEADIVFGAVTAASPPAGCFIPEYRVRRTAWARGLSQKCRVEGIGACFAYRRVVWEVLGGFDDTLGAGGEFRSAEEVDFTFRALAQGGVVMETPEISVVHHGFRRSDIREELLRGHLFGIGAASAKQVRSSF